MARTITDLKVWGSVGDFPLQFTRYGMSRLNSGLKWFGDGHIWRHSYQWELTTSGSNVRVLYYPDGTVQRFTYSGGAWVGIASCPDYSRKAGLITPSLGLTAPATFSAVHRRDGRGVFPDARHHRSLGQRHDAHV